MKLSFSWYVTCINWLSSRDSNMIGVLTIRSSSWIFGLNTVEIVMGLKKEFGITVEEYSAQSIITVQDDADLIEKFKDNA
ncbi:hypothetical protein Ddye_008389 [Dipteronia dyeriana]|uniref:Acyl carrier protein n=1 Tax=Dipteronia dyeriana TaxID=168575 RepID=A0AAD9X9S3_9ROSI|nr:hypothetical protein Ddye_008389 [Dipteronia dyeriana]